jgi:hypothetical protein
MNAMDSCNSFSTMPLENALNTIRHDKEVVLLMKDNIYANALRKDFPLLEDQISGPDEDTLMKAITNRKKVIVVK